MTKTNNVVERLLDRGRLTLLLAMVEADIKRTSEAESFMVRSGLLRDLIIENQSLSDRIAVLEGALEDAVGLIHERCLSSANGCGLNRFQLRRYKKALAASLKGDK